MNLRKLWASLTKPREALIPRLLRERKLRRETAAQVVYELNNDRDYDRAIRAYLALWLEETSEEAHYQTAWARFGLDQYWASFVDHVLASAAMHTLHTWMNGHDITWWQAAWRYSQARDRVLLDQLRWRLEHRS
jgi:hypothetical protein